MDIERAIAERLEGDAREGASAFVARLKERGFSFEGFPSGGGTRWTPSYRGEGFGCAAVEDRFMFWIGLVDWFDVESNIDPELARFAWSRVVNCPQVKYCAPPYCQGDARGNNRCKNRFRIFGKEYGSVCHAPLAFFGPSGEEFGRMLRLLEFAEQSGR